MPKAKPLPVPRKPSSNSKVDKELNDKLLQQDADPQIEAEERYGDIENLDTDYNEEPYPPEANNENKNESNRDEYEEEEDDRYSRSDREDDIYDDRNEYDNNDALKPY